MPVLLSRTEVNEVPFIWDNVQGHGAVLLYKVIKDVTELLRIVSWEHVPTARQLTLRKGL